MKYIRENYIDEIETEELDWAIQSELGIGEEEDYETVTFTACNSYWMKESLPINRLELIKLLQKHETSHVEIDYHQDHRTYNLNYVDIRLMDANEVKNYKKELKAKFSKEKQEEIKEI